MDELSIFYIVIAMCCVMAIISAYLIYNNTQEEKKEYYKNKWRQERAHTKADYDLEDLAKPVEAKPSVKPAMLAAVAVTVPEPETVVPKSVSNEPLPPAEDPFPHVENADDSVECVPLVESVGAPAGIPEPPAPMLVTSGAVAGAALLTYGKATKYPPLPDETPEPSETEHKKQKKKKGTRVQDFDDYRNGSPPFLPPANPAPEPARYNYDAQPEVKATPAAPRVNQSSVDRDGLEF